MTGAKTSFLPVYGLPRNLTVPAPARGEYWLLLAYHPADVLMHGPSGWTRIQDRMPYGDASWVKTVWLWTSPAVPDPPIVFTSHACEARAFVQAYRSESEGETMAGKLREEGWLVMPPESLPELRDLLNDEGRAYVAEWRKP
jgi:hypothetical protein